MLLAAGTKTYRYGGLADLNQVPDALRCVVETLTGLGYRPSAPAGAGLPGYLLDPGLQELRSAVREAAGLAPVVVVYYTGHGMKPGRDPYYLVTAEATSGQLEDTALEARKFVGLVLRRDEHDQELPDDEQPQVLVILDCCFSGAGGAEALNESLQDIGSPKVWVLASASSVEYAQQGRFAEALQQALLNPDVGSRQDFLSLDWVAGKINAVLGQAAGQKARYFPPGGQSTGLTPFFPNPKYVPDVAGLTVAGFYVTGQTGRMRVMQDLAGWMRDPDRGGLAVVTGSPGSGKSAMLALPVLLAEDQARDTLLASVDPTSLVARCSDFFENLSVTGIHARGMNPYQVEDTIAEHLGRSADSHGLLEDLRDHPQAAPRIIVIDAVDEARDPQRLMNDLLLPLARQPFLRVIVGARRHVLPPAADTSLIIDLDSRDYCDPRALVEYAHQLLVAAREPNVPSPYRDCDAHVTVTVAAMIADKATARPTATGQAESFLLAQLLARAVRSRPQVLDVTLADWAEQLPADVGAAFDEDLRRLGKREPIARALLSALAWARGPGLPWENIWVPVAQMLADATGNLTLQLDDDHVRWLLNTAGAYVAEDLGPGQRSVYRPFHDLLAAHLRDGHSGRPAGAEAAQVQRTVHRASTEAIVSRAVLETVPTGGHIRDWTSAHPYVRTYLAQHATAAGPEIFSALVHESGFLAVADPVTLTPLLPATDSALRDLVRTYRRARPLLGDDPHANVAYLNEAVRALTGAAAPEDSAIRPLYRTYLASVHRDDSLLVLPSYGPIALGAGLDGRLFLACCSSDPAAITLWDPATGAPVSQPLIGHEYLVDSLTFGVDPAGQLFLASGGDRTIRLWDPDLGTAVGNPLIYPPSYDHPDEGKICSLAFGTRPDGRLLLASGSGDGAVRVWDPHAAVLLYQPPARHREAVSSLAFGTGPDWRLYLASGSWDRTIRLLDAATGIPVRAPFSGLEESVDEFGVPVMGPFSGLEAPVEALAFGPDPDGHPILASCEMGGPVRLWNPVTGTQVGDPFTGLGEAVTASAFGADPDGHLLVASGSHDGTVRLWDPLTRAPASQPLQGHTGPVRNMAFGADLDGRLLLASGSEDGTVRLWDPALNVPASQQLPGHSRPVTSVAFGADSDGRLLLASGSEDGTVRLWDPALNAPVSQPLLGHSWRVSSVAFGVDPDGRLLLASGSYDKTARLWNPMTGEQLGTPLSGHTSLVDTVAFGTGPGGRLLLASGSSDGTIRLWDPQTGRPAGPLLTGHGGCLTFVTTPDGHLLLADVSIGGKLRIWNLATNGVMSEFPDDHGRVFSIAFGIVADGRRLLATGNSDGTVRLWDPFTSTPVGRPMIGHASAVTSLVFSATTNGRLLVGSSSYQTVRLWDPATTAPVTTISRRSPISSVAAANGLLAIGDREGISVIEVVWPM